MCAGDSAWDATARVMIVHSQDGLDSPNSHVRHTSRHVAPCGLVGPWVGILATLLGLARLGRRRAKLSLVRRRENNCSQILGHSDRGVAFKSAGTRDVPL